MFDNSSVKVITFVVPDNSALMVKNVMNAPNPLVDHTNFIFQPQQFDGGALNVQIQIYNLQGIMVRKLEQNYPDPMAAGLKIPWDGTDANGRNLSNGIYPYKVIFNATNGANSMTAQKLMIIR
jgi:flagellar hook assembly protein FlgD